MRIQHQLFRCVEALAIVLFVSLCLPLVASATSATPSAVSFDPAMRMTLSTGSLSSTGVTWLQPIPTPAPATAPIFNMAKAETVADQIFTWLLIALVPYLGYWVAKGAPAVDAFIKTHVANVAVQGILVRLDDLIWTLVSAAEQTMVADFTKGNPTPGEGLTKEQGKAIFDDVLAKLKAMLGENGVQDIERVLGLQGNAIETFLGQRIESAVLKVGK